MLSQRADGFTLLEVLVAFAIVGLALVALFKGTSFGLDAADRAGRYEEALSRARSHLEGLGPDVGRMVGHHTADDGAGYRWTLDVNVVPVVTQNGPPPSSRVPPLYAVVVSESWHDGPRLRSVTLTSERLGRQNDTAQ